MQTQFPTGGGDAALPPSPERVLTVAELNRFARQALEARFPLLWVAGEISNLTRAPSGHIYFTLKDDQAQVRCAMWRNRSQLLRFRPENGMRVEARALVTLYEARGEFQLGIEALRPGGVGSLYEAFVRLRERLDAEGLFDPATKRALPRYPRRLGVVTSPAAAALQDVLAALRRRAPQLDVVLYPAPVQGAGAGARLAEAVRCASARAAGDRIDLLLVVRGGGSIEDLWAFNDEALARAIRACPVPVVCGVGHETDVTIADFAADVRAATPTGAAELASAGYHEACMRIAELGRTLAGLLDRRLHGLAQRLDRAALRLVHPRERLALARERTERLAARLGTATARGLEQRRSRLALLAVRLEARRPNLAREAERCARLGERLAAAADRQLRRRAERLAALAAHLEHLAPDAVLARGYSIARDEQGRILRAAAQVGEDDRITVELASGRLRATVNGSEA